MPRSLSLLAATVLTAILSPSITGVLGADPTVCTSDQLDWYTSVVGETPCVTYQRLRQICNSDYKVGAFSPNTPGDTCNDQVSACCCNSVSFALSMLCMNCQYDTATGDSGIDAGNGAYGLYLDGCGPISNKTLPTNIQTAVCNKEIKIENDLYSLFWGDTGAWFYVYTKETMEETFSATNNNSFTHCNSTSVNNTSSATPSSSTAITAGTNTPTQTTAPSSAADTGSKSNIGPIIGGVVGGVIGAAAVGVVLFFLLRKQRQNSGPKPLDLSKEYYNEDASRPFQDEPHVVTPYTEGSVAMSSRYGASNYAQSEEPETYNLIPRGPPGPGSVVTDSNYAYGQQAMSTFSGFDDERHEDGGPVAALQRSNSGRLPPAYQSWEPAPPAPESTVGYGASSEYASQEGGSSASGRSAGGSALRLVSPGRSQYPADVKRPLPESS